MPDDPYFPDRDEEFEQTRQLEYFFSEDKNPEDIIEFLHQIEQNMDDVTFYIKYELSNDQGETRWATSDALLFDDEYFDDWLDSFSEDADHYGMGYTGGFSVMLIGSI